MYYPVALRGINLHEADEMCPKPQGNLQLGPHKQSKTNQKNNYNKL